MSRLVDWQIRDLCIRRKNRESVGPYSGWPTTNSDISDDDWYGKSEGKPQPMLEPFSESVKGGLISYGLSHCGYDLRLGQDFVQFVNPVLTHGQIPVIDPKRFGDPDYETLVVKRWNQNYPVTIPPNSYILGRSLEYIRIPNWLCGDCTGKSTLARSGILINTTPIEPGWEGHLCIEIGNCTNLPAVIYPGEGICQLVFTKLDAKPEIDYAAKGGKYQGQTGVTLSKV